MNNKIHLTFTYPDNLDSVLEKIETDYEVFMGKVFVLTDLDSTKVMCTYNIISGGGKTRLPNTILVHRKKQTNTLYTINALNELIKNLNNGVLDKTYPIEWNDYRSSLLLHQNNEFKAVRTKLFKIIKV
tara:strand:+ start:257 stop:643 length:387 start_codon:yes stop_codon:yes gene_type:complete